MARKVQSTTTTAAKPATRSKTKMTDAFSTVAAPAKKRAVKKATAEVSVDEVKPVKKAAATRKRAVTLDPFAETTTATSPAKQRPAKAAKSDVKTVKAAAKAPAAPKKAVKKSVKTTEIAVAAELDVTAEIAAAEPKVELSPAFKLLAEPVLPALKRQNRARLQMQTPTRLYFYWSVKENPWAMLRSVFGDDLGSYTLVLKLIDKKFGIEEIHQTEAEGNYWFNVEPNRSYQAEIGFYAPNRPYFRVLYSNVVETPRRSPSPRAATESDWRINSAKFAEVLDVAGFSRDAFDVAMAGDDQRAAEDAAHRAFTQFLGTADYASHGITAEDIRYAMLALASGVTLDELRHRVSAALYAILQASAGSIVPSRAMTALTDNFDIEEAVYTEEEFGAAVYGASLVNFPRTLKTKTLSPRSLTPKYAPRYNPVSSGDLG